MACLHFQAVCDGDRQDIAQLKTWAGGPNATRAAVQGTSSCASLNQYQVQQCLKRSALGEVLMEQEFEAGEA